MKVKTESANRKSESNLKKQQKLNVGLAPTECSVRFRLASAAAMLNYSLGLINMCAPNSAWNMMRKCRDDAFSYLNRWLKIGGERISHLQLAIIRYPARVSVTSKSRCSCCCCCCFSLVPIVRAGWLGFWPLIGLIAGIERQLKLPFNWQQKVPTQPRYSDEIIC